MRISIVPLVVLSGGVALAAALLCLAISDASAAVDDVRTWGGADDEVAFLERDALGHSYLVGFTSSFAPPGTKVLITKYDADRNLLWSRAWAWDGGEIEVNGTDVTPDGVFFAGNTANGDLILASFDPDGDFVWARTWDGNQPGDFDFADGVAVDGAGGVFVGGGTRTVTNERVLVVKFTTAGDFDWARTWQRNGADSCNNVAVDSFGNLFCGGNSVDSFFRREALVVKFDSSGSLNWARTWRNDALAAFDDDAFGIAVDPSGNPVLVGGSEVGGEPEHAMVVKFLANGDLAWSRIWGKTLDGSPGTSDGTGSLHIDGSGNIFTGTFLGTSEDPLLGDALLLKFAPDGALLHAKAWGGDPARVYGFSSSDASDPFELFVGGVTDAATGVLGNVCRETVTPIDRVTLPNANVESPGDGSSPTSFHEVVATGCATPPCGGWDMLLLRLTPVCIGLGTDPDSPSLALAKGDCGPPTGVSGRTVEVIRGELDQVALAGESVDLGFVECVGIAEETDRVEDLSDTPERGTKGYYFLARNPALETDFGTAEQNGNPQQPRDQWTSDPLCSCPKSTSVQRLNLDPGP